MNKRIMAVAAGLAVLAGTASAAVLQQWTFDEPAGTVTHQLTNTGTPGDAVWSWGAASEFVTDGNGNLECVPGAGGYKTATFADALAGGQTYSFEVVVSEWNAVTNTVQLQCKLGSEVEIYAVCSTNNGLQFKFKADGNYQNFTVATNLSGTTEHKARIDFNIDAGTAAFFVDDVDVTGSWLNLTGLTFDNAMSMIWQKSADFPVADPATVLKISSQTLSNEDLPGGTYVLDKYFSQDVNTVTNSIVKTFTVNTNDVIVVVTASTSKDDPAETNIVFGGTASLDPVTYAPADPWKGSRSSYWYTKATTDGTVSLEVQRNGAYFIVGAYQLRAGAGYTAPALLGSPLTYAGTATSITNTYTLGTNYTGVCIEALSTYAVGFEPVSPEIIANGSGYQNKRNVASGTFSGVASLDSIWATTNAANQLTWVGLAFASTPDGIVPTPQEQFDSWLAGYSVGGDTGLMDDPDGDLLNNLVEYAFGGAPDNASDQGNTPVQSTVEDGGTNYLEYIYYERTDASYRQLSSLLEVGNDLVITNWADGSSYETGRGASGVTDFDAVTNRIPTDSEAKQFIKLDIQLGN